MGDDDFEDKANTEDFGTRLYAQRCAPSFSFLNATPVFGSTPLCVFSTLEGIGYGRAKRFFSLNRQPYWKGPDQLKTFSHAQCLARVGQGEGEESTLSTTALVIREAAEKRKQRRPISRSGRGKEKGEKADI